MSVAYVGGVIVGIVCCVIVFAIIAAVAKKMGRRGPCEFDERQELIRGRGFKYGFFTLLIYNLIIGPLMNALAQDKLFDATTQNTFGVCIALLIFGGYCILNDAYMSLNEKPIATYILLGATGTMNLVIGLADLFHGTMVRDGKLSYHASNLMIGVDLLLLVLVFLIRNIRNREE